MGEDAQLGEGAEDRDEGDAERQQRRDRAAEREQQQDQGDRDGDAFREGQILADLTADVGALVAADPQRRSGRIDVAVVVQDPGGVGIVAADDARQDQRVGAVTRAQRRGPRRPVGRDAGQAVVLAAGPR